MPKSKKSTKLTQSSTKPATEPNSGYKKKKNKKNKKNNNKSKKNDPKILPKNKKTKKKKNKKSKTRMTIDLEKVHNKKKKKNKTKNKKDDNKRGRAKTVNKPTTSPRSDRSKSKSKKNKKKQKKEYQLHDDEKKEEPKAKKKKKFPWAKWMIDKNDDAETTDDDDNPFKQNKHQTRRSSLGSVREFYRPKTKKATIKTEVMPCHKINQQKKEKKEKKKKKKEHKEGGKVDIYDPNAMKKHRKKEKKAGKFKVVPKHRIRRSSLPTYNSIRKNNPTLTRYVAKESKRDLSTLLDQPEKRAKSKHLKNLSQAGFELHVNKRYRLEDGRVGVCKFKGRTQFGKSSEDWIGLVIEIGEGEHDGSVKGKSYFRCREGKGLFVRPYDIIQDMGSQNKLLSKQDIKLAKKHIKRYKKLKNSGLMTSTGRTDGDHEADHGDSMLNEKFYNPKTLIDKNKGKKAKTKKRYFEV